MTSTSKRCAKSLTVLFLVSAIAQLSAQQRPFTGTPDLEQSLRKLNELGSVLMIAAHPDDERTSVLAYFARGRYMRTAYLSCTRGEGGQNLIGPEQGAQLGIIRTQELLAARQIDGAEQFFTRAIDFGFSKTAAETMEKWGHERILSDMVWVIRRYRPDVIVLVFSGTPRDGHGQHQVSAILGKEAFRVSGDPTRFPGQLKYTAAWQAKRLVRVEWFGGRGPAGNLPPDAPSSGQTDTGAFNPILGYSYEELAVLSRSMHHSQGTGAMRHPGASLTPWLVVDGAPVAANSNDMFDGIDHSWNRVAGGAAVGRILSRAIGEFDPLHPEKALPELTRARPLIAAMDDPLAKVKLAELDEAIARCAGLWVEAQAKAPDATPGSELNVTTTVLNRSTARVSFEGESVEGIWNEEVPARQALLGDNQSVTIPFARQIPPAQPYSQPYWLVKPPSGDVYTVDDQRLIGLADTPAVVRMRLRVSVDGTPIEMVRPVHFRYANPAEGERTRPLAIVPPVAVQLPQAVEMFPRDTARAVHIAVLANVANASGEVRLAMPAGWKSQPESQPFHLAAAGEQQPLTFVVTPPGGESIGAAHAVATVAGREIAWGMQVISYPHFPPQTLFPPSDIKVVRADVKVTAHHIGYIMGAGDEMPAALRQLGLDVTLLSAADLEEGDLGRFDAIVAGVRAYNMRADVRANQTRLLEYVKGGGTYIVQYQTGDNALSLGPYPFTVPPGSGYRVTVEQAPVTFPHPDSPLLQGPNGIAPQDFEGWVQERGLYFAAQWDPRYQTVLASHDPGEKDLEGGELWTRYGQGVYIFTAYDWFRELPSGVPGAYRLFANLLSAK
jgi:LmbE family N-acetylglucosaminyl deacetylase